jgi:hypothetical protein
MKFNDHRPFLFKYGVPQPLSPASMAISAATICTRSWPAAAGVNTAGYLVQVIAHAGKLTQQRRRDRGSFPARAGFSSRQVCRIHAASCLPSQRSSSRRCSSSVTHMVSILLRFSAKPAS